MKHLLFIAIILVTCRTARAQSAAIVVDSGATQTVVGVGGNATLSYAFAKGDRVTVTGHASKLLERMQVTIYPDIPVGSHKYTKDVDYSFTMAEAGICIISFISDRGGKDTIHYLITRTPASAATAAYNTKVVWQKSAQNSGMMEPHQAGR